MNSPEDEQFNDICLALCGEDLFLCGKEDPERRGEVRFYLLTKESDSEQPIDRNAAKALWYMHPPPTWRHKFVPDDNLPEDHLFAEWENECLPNI